MSWQPPSQIHPSQLRLLANAYRLEAGKAFSEGRDDQAVQLRAASTRLDELADQLPPLPGAPVPGEGVRVRDVP